MYWNLNQDLKLKITFWLTLTWDVLKFISREMRRECNEWLTLTWDVLKWLLLMSVKMLISININMRCIEIKGKNIIGNMEIRLTLTWDVLK